MKVYILSFWNGDANTYLLDEEEIYSSEKAAKLRKKELIDLSKERGSVYGRMDWGYLYDRGDSGIEIEEGVIK